MQILLVAQQVGVLDLGVVSQDGTKIHADASKSQAVSYQRLLGLVPRLEAEVAALFALAEQAEQQEMPAGLVVEEELARRQARLAQLTLAKAVLEARAADRVAAEQAEYEAKLAERAAKAARTGKKPGGRPPTPPTPGPRATDQYNFTDPESRIMKNSTDAGFDQQYNAQVGGEPGQLAGGRARRSPPIPTTSRKWPPPLTPSRPSWAHPGRWCLMLASSAPPTSEPVRSGASSPISRPGATPTTRPCRTWWRLPRCPAARASPRVQMAYKLQTPQGKALYRTRKYTVEPVLGIIKEVLGFRQFSLRGEVAAAGEWCLVCLAYNLKRLPVLLGGVLPSVVLARLASSPDGSETDPAAAPDRAETPCRRLRFKSVVQQLRCRIWRRFAPHASLASGLSRCLFSPTGC